MPSKLQLRRTDLVGRAPTTNEIDLGEVVLNVADGRMFFKKVEGGKVYTRFTAIGDDNHHVYFTLDAPLIENETYRIELEARPGETGWTDEVQLGYYDDGSAVNEQYYPIYNGWHVFTYEFVAGAVTGVPSIRVIGWREGLDGEIIDVGDVKVYAVNDTNQPNLVDKNFTPDSGWQTTSSMDVQYYDGSIIESIVDIYDHDHEINDIGGLEEKIDSVDSNIQSVETELTDKVDINNLGAVQIHAETEKVAVTANTQTFSLSQITLKTNMPMIFMAGYYDSQLITDFTIDSPTQITLTNAVPMATTLTVIQNVLVAA